LYQDFKGNHMEEKQVALLTVLAEKLKTEKKDKARVVASLQSAKILTKSGNFTEHYSSLKKVEINTK
jgi:hypothetical protein